jgi:hypothetical protein
MDAASIFSGGGGARRFLTNLDLKLISMVILGYSGYKTIFLKNNFNSCHYLVVSFFFQFLFFPKIQGGGGEEDKRLTCHLPPAGAHGL